MLLNLVGNAIKFTDEGEVVVHVEVAGGPTQDEVGLHFTVHDTGMGIPRDQQQASFGRSSRRTARPRGSTAAPGWD